MKALIFDTETTGIVDPAIVEAAGIHCKIVYSSLFEGDFFCSRFNPGKPISYGAMATHHIMDEDVADMPPASTFALPEGIEYLIGHNVDYDWEAIGKPDVKRICTLAISRMLWPDADHSQSALMYLLERHRARELVKNAHSALADVRICQLILDHILRKIVANDLEELWELSEKARVPTVMRIGKYSGTAIKDLPADYVAWFLRQKDVDPYLRTALSSR